MYSLSQIRDEIRIYKLKQILSSGENDMFDNKIDREKVEKMLQEIECEKDNTKSCDLLDLNKTLNNIDKEKALDSIINLKNRHVG